MEEIKCQGCDNTFPSGSGNPRKWCSGACRARKYNRKVSPTERPCPDCGASVLRKGNESHRCPSCRSAHTETRQYAQRRDRKARGRDYMRSHLLNNPCVDCGETDIEVLQFDHRGDATGRRGSNVGAFTSYSTERIQREIDLCDIRCANCHYRRTRRQMGWSWT